ncbi:molybdate ABC transporter substrate-binding protein [Anaerosporobacter sp.]|uniref:molybdate ABC transporter substrate-binding protein n=1 Tax=Anaerosporobacter sp. TaxID=1872529 RepID=UPI00286F1075|nr:molybdate ABC transporter substrate-binding protein [Anaerosporobacter sp.]
MKIMKKRRICFVFLLILIVSAISGCATKKEDKVDVKEEKATEIQVFIAASLSNAMEEIKALYAKKEPNVTITYNADSSGTLLTQVQEGYECDIFFSAAPKQMNTLESGGYLVEGTRKNVLNNQVVLITSKGSKTQVTGFDTMHLAKSMALAGGSVPVGKYARTILVNLGYLDMIEDSAVYTAEEVSRVLGGLEINECGNVSKVTEAVKEAANEIGIVYYSDAYAVKDDVDIIAYADKELTGDIIYPVAQVANTEADVSQTQAASDFLEFLDSEEAKAIFEKYMFLIYKEDK